MPRLVDALRTLGLTAETALSGRWVKIEGERCAVYVVESSWGEAFYSWCDDPQERAVERHRDSVEAIRSGLRRARRPQGRDDEG